MTTEHQTRTNRSTELEEGEIFELTLISNQKINKDTNISNILNSTDGEDKIQKENAETMLHRYMVKKCADFFTKEEYSKFLGFLTDFVCDKALENPDFDPRIVSVTRSDKYRNVIKVQCDNMNTCKWFETLDFSKLLNIKVVICTENTVDRTALDLVQVDVVIPIIPGSRIRTKEEIIPIFKGTNKNSAFRFDEWKIKSYEHNSVKINVSFHVSSEIAEIIRENNTLSFGTSQISRNFIISEFVY
ncbi:hypothetical protein O3M35_011856 [Rhynocoris fuscipes]|uniref:Uncharacterized protein n=1 Tax=Rhynocoris fuscipes TaxID=488301 RepID=A0AAW1D309_9HEMI